MDIADAIRQLCEPDKAACAAAVIPAVMLTGFGLVGGMINNVAGPIYAFAWPFVPLVLLMTAAFGLARLERSPNKLNPA